MSGRYPVQTVNSQLQDDQLGQNFVYSSLQNDLFDHTYASNSLLEESSSVLKLVSLNVCDLMSKTNYPDFINFVNKFDFICLSETNWTILILLISMDISILVL